MRKFLITATVLGTAALAAAFAAPNMDDTSASPIASSSARQKAAPTAKAGGLLNTDVTQHQARKAAQLTNRQVARGGPDKRDR